MRYADRTCAALSSSRLVSSVGVGTTTAVSSSRCRAVANSALFCRAVAHVERASSRICATVASRHLQIGLHLLESSSETVFFSYNFE